MDCGIAQDIWIGVCHYLKIDSSWYSIPLEENLKLWFLSKPKDNFVPFMVLWGIWLHINNVLFKGFRPNIKEVCRKIYKIMIEYKVENNTEKLQVLVNPMFFGNSPIGFFDGAATSSNSGIGVLIKLSSSHTVKAFMSIGVGSNTRAELITLWTMLFLSKTLGI